MALTTNGLRLLVPGLPEFMDVLVLIVPIV